MDAPKIADDPIYGEIRAAICDHYIASGKPTPKQDWLYTRLVEAHVQLRVMDGGLALASELGEALKPLIPERNNLLDEQLEKWQKVIDVIFRAAEYAEKHGLTTQTKKLPQSTTHGG